MVTRPVPLHWVRLESNLVAGCFCVGVIDKLPIEGVSLLLGNDIAGGTVTPVLEVVEEPFAGADGDDLSAGYPTVFPDCVVTQAQSRRLGEGVNLADSVFERPKVSNDKPLPKNTVSKRAMQLSDIVLSITPSKVLEAQKVDDSLSVFWR